MGLDIHATNRSRGEVSSSIGTETIRVIPRGAGLPGGRRSGPEMEGGGASGRFAGVEMAMRRPDSVGWTTEMVQPRGEGLEMQEDGAGQELGQPEAFYIDLGVENIRSPRADRTPTTIISSNIHPAFRPSFDNASRPVSHDGSQTPREAPDELEQNQI